jgi:tripartite-type tricarboxylate transporter receptor subunit TctC
MAVKTGTPQPILDRLHRELTEVLKTKEIADLLAHDSALPSPETPAAFASFLAGEQKKWAPVVRRAGLTAL